MTIYKFIGYIFFFCICSLHHPGAAETKPEVNTLDKEKWENISSGLDYSEDEKEEEPEPKKAEQKAEPISQGVDPSFLAPLLKIAGFILAIALLGFILARILPSLLSNGNARVENRISIDAEEELKEENIAEWPLQKLLNKYIQEGDIRNAIRIYYLMALQLLHLNGFIKWEKDKTNSRYVMEFASHERSKDFSTLTRIYETTWYGQFIPDEAMFAIAKSQFTMFNAQFPMPDEK
ncbi:MAG: hypothetical protein H7259_08930 [Cytophagales bacterium]|nr:hypothetical protein [Cytophaga sp.]